MFKNGMIHLEHDNSEVNVTLAELAGFYGTTKPMHLPASLVQSELRRDWILGPKIQVYIYTTIITWCKWVV